MTLMIIKSLVFLITQIINLWAKDFRNKNTTSLGKPQGS